MGLWKVLCLCAYQIHDNNLNLQRWNSLSKGGLCCRLHLWGVEKTLLVGLYYQVNRLFKDRTRERWLSVADFAAAPPEAARCLHAWDRSAQCQWIWADRVEAPCHTVHTRGQVGNLWRKTMKTAIGVDSPVMNANDSELRCVWVLVDLLIITSWIVQLKTTIYQVLQLNCSLFQSFIPTLCQWVSHHLKFGKKEWFLGLETLQTFGAFL